MHEKTTASLDFTKCRRASTTCILEEPVPKACVFQVYGVYRFQPNLSEVLTPERGNQNFRTCRSGGPEPGGNVCRPCDSPQSEQQVIASAPMSTLSLGTCDEGFFAFGNSHRAIFLSFYETCFFGCLKRSQSVHVGFSTFQMFFCKSLDVLDFKKVQPEFKCFSGKMCQTEA